MRRRLFVVLGMVVANTMVDEPVVAAPAPASTAPAADVDPQAPPSRPLYAIAPAYLERAAEQAHREKWGGELPED